MAKLPSDRHTWSTTLVAREHCPLTLCPNPIHERAKRPLEKSELVYMVGQLTLHPPILERKRRSYLWEKLSLVAVFPFHFKSDGILRACRLLGRYYLAKLMLPFFRYLTRTGLS